METANADPHLFKARAIAAKLQVELVAIVGEGLGIGGIGDATGTE